MLLLVILVPLVSGWGLWGYGNNCGVKRSDVIPCFATHIDSNRDGILSLEEIETAKDKYSTGIMSIVERVLQYKVDASAKKLLEDCDANHDGVFTTEDWMASVKHCIPTQLGMCLLKKVCDNADALELSKSSPSFMNSLKSWGAWV